MAEEPGEQTLIFVLQDVPMVSRILFLLDTVYELMCGIVKICVRLCENIFKLMTVYARCGRMLVRREEYSYG